MNKTILLLISLIILINFSGKAWVYPEHRDIALLAIQKLEPEYRSILDKLWAEARVGYEERLTEAVIDATQSIKPTHLDFASWPAISGDHSCSPENLLYTVLQTEWILKVADIAAQLKIDIANAKNRSSHVNALRDSDLKLQRADPEYATRAGSNNVHFLLARPNVNSTAKEYILSCLVQGAELNALGAYAWFHVSALYKAARYANENLSAEERSALILAAFADEAFALHFLEDVFASGHTAGTWGDASQRKGTHDYYNEKGLEVVTWDGERLILMGDAYIRPVDAEIAALTIKMSLEQFIDAANEKSTLNYKSDLHSSVNLPDSFNVCRNNFMPIRKLEDDNLRQMLSDVLVKTPVPGLATGLGELPRFRTELGLFIGVVPSLRTSAISGGFGVEQKNAGAVGGLDINVRIGLGIEGVLNESGDGLVFLDFGWRQDGPSTQSFGSTPLLIQGGQITSAIPGRDALNIRFRMPFYILPFDLIIASPILLFAPDVFTSMAVIAGNGGLIPWQTGIATSFGRFQFILGREIGAALYGGGDNLDAILVPENAQTILLNYKSIQFDFPVLEYRPFRTFSLDQSSSLVVQLNFGVDLPYDEVVVLPAGAEAPDLKPVWSIGMRIAFDWRYYF
jgi:hypothetical protein